MSSVVVDTDVVSFVFKNHSIGVQYDADLAGRILIASFMTLAELDRWTIQSKWAEVTVAAQAGGYPIEARTPGSRSRRSSMTYPLLLTIAATIEASPGLVLISHSG